jgi:general secretion pathway protein A
MLNLAVNELGFIESKKKMTVAETIQCLNQYAIEQAEIGGTVLIIVDEAQNLKKSELENIRLLSNIESRKTKLIQILLCGQLKLEYKLSRPELSQLIQRISVKRYIKNLSEKDTYHYIKHRLKIGGYRGPAIFDKQSLRLIWKNTEGVPLQINMLCENSLLIGYATEKKNIDKFIVRKAIKQLSYNHFQNREIW